VPITDTPQYRCRDWAVRRYQILHSYLSLIVVYLTMPFQ
jgi:hypothetical protein